MRWLVLIFIGIALSACAQSNCPEKEVANLDLNSMLQSQPHYGGLQSVTFLSDSSLAVGLCPETQATRCALSILHFEEISLSVSSTTQELSPAHMHFQRSAGESVLGMSMGAMPAVLFSRNLQSVRVLKHFDFASDSGRTLAASGSSGWEVYRLRGELQSVMQGVGQVEAVSDDLIAWRMGKEWHIETFLGVPLGRFAFVDGEKCPVIKTKFIGPGALLLSDCHTSRVVAFSGKELLRISGRRLRGELQSQSASGGRLLFAGFDRRTSRLRAAAENFRAIVTLGMGVPDEPSNREHVTVIDSATGSVCLKWQRDFPENAEVPSQNAAISPSGEWVALIVSGRLAIYHVPDACHR